MLRMFCTNCGAELKAGARFCGQCGTAIASSEENGSYKSKNESTFSGIESNDKPLPKQSVPSSALNEKGEYDPGLERSRRTKQSEQPSAALNPQGKYDPGLERSRRTKQSEQPLAALNPQGKYDPGLAASRGVKNQSNIKKKSISNKYFLLYIFAYNFYWIIQIAYQRSYGFIGSDSLAFGFGAVIIPLLAMLASMLMPNKRNRSLMLLVISIMFLGVFKGNGY